MQLNPSKIPVKILGIDPGSLVVGFCLLESKKVGTYNPSDFRMTDAGVLQANKKLSHAHRIGELHQALYELVVEIKPTHCIMEQAFYGVNARSALRLGEARGALVSALSRIGIVVEEITPTQVKKTVTGSGHADKNQVRLAIEALLRVKLGNLPLDASDAAAIALSYGLSLAMIPSQPEPLNARELR